MGQLSEVDNYELADDRHRIRERLQIGSVLRDAMSRQCFVNIECERGVHLVTTILEVNTADSTFVYDWGGSESASAALKASQVIRFSMSLGGVPVSFTIHQADECEFDGRRAFESSFPEDILYIQRREYFRARAKIAMPFQCEGTLPDGQKVSLSVYDLSLGGVGLRSKDITPEIMPVGSVIRDASLNFDEYGTIKAPMKVVTCVRLGNDVKPWHHFGCAFLSLGSAEPMVQKMVFALERSTKKK